MRIVFVSSALPRRCGLATFTEDLRNALADVTGWEMGVCAIDRDRLMYGPEVVAIIAQDDPADYRRAARFLASAEVDLVVIEHEYGIFGGPDGAHVLELADELRVYGVPYAVTLHTLLSQPSDGQRETLRALCSGASTVTVFTQQAHRLALATGVADAGKLTVIGHGAPVVLRQPVPHHKLRPDVAEMVQRLGGRRLLTTFGLVGPGKGLEKAIEAMAGVTSRHPDAHYLIAGATHPEVVRHEGEVYREKLGSIADELGVGDRVHFLNTFLTDEELSVVLARTDIFLTPYRSPEQICSGALTFALAAGRAVVSTSYRYAEEMLTPKPGGNAPGVMVPCDDTAAMAEAIGGLLRDPVALAEAQQAADRLGRTLTWPQVAGDFATAFSAAAQPATVPGDDSSGRMPWRLAHLDRMVNNIGIVQFAEATMPAMDSGYCVDDVARLAIVATGLVSTRIARALPEPWLRTGLQFLGEAVRADGMHNLMDRHGSWLDRPHIGDHVGRAIWAAGTVAGAHELPQDLREDALRLLGWLAPTLSRSGSAHTLAYGLLGLTQWPAHELDAPLWTAARRLADMGNSEPGWPWFEPVLTYDNARLPQALIAAGLRMGDDTLATRGLSTLDWYLSHVGLTGDRPTLRLVGNNWRGEEAQARIAEGDEQPLDAAAVVEALVLAAQYTGEQRYLHLARTAFAWFHGTNRAGAALYDAASGGCRDGLSAVAASVNQGAESTLAYYQAMLALLPLLTQEEVKHVAEAKVLRHYGLPSGRQK